MQKKYLVVLMVCAFALFLGMLYSLFKTVFENPEGRILASKDYAYETTKFTESIYIYTGSDLLFAGSGRILKNDDVIVTEIKYSSGATTIHRKIAISSGSLVQDTQGVFKIELASGAVISDALNDDGDTGVFKKIYQNGFIEIIGSGAVLIAGEGNWNYLDETKESVEVTFIEKAEDATELYKTVTFSISNLEAEDKTAIKLYLAIGKTLSEFKNKKFDSERFGTPITHFETGDEETSEEEKENTQTMKNTSIKTDLSDFSEEDKNTSQQESNAENKNSNTLYWGKYTDTDEGNYELARDKLNVNYCQRIKDSSLQEECEQTIYEELGKCDLLDDLRKSQACQNIKIKERAISSESLSRCIEIVDDENLKQKCISEINQIFYDTAIQNSDSSVCKAIYNATLLKKCLEVIGENGGK